MRFQKLIIYMAKLTNCSQCHSESHIKQDCPFYNVTSKFSKVSVSYGNDYQHYDIPVYDTHCHLDYVFDRFKHNGVSFKEFMRNEYFPTNFKGCITSFSDMQTYSSFSIWPELLDQEEVWGTFGLHPHFSKYFDCRIEAKLLECLKHPKAIGVGECGLDLSIRCLCSLDVQKQVFVKQLRLAKQINKPVVIHSREAEDLVYNILCNEDMKEWPIHVHCFTGTCSQLHRFVNEFPNMFFGFTNLVAYSTAKSTREVAKSVPLDRVLLETDAPYFVPKSLKKKNQFSHPGNVIFVAEEIAAIKNKDVEVVLENCRSNLMKLFKI